MLARPEQVAIGLGKMRVCQKIADAGQRRHHFLLLNVHVAEDSQPYTEGL
jgi:hypothetical protein